MVYSDRLAVTRVQPCRTRAAASLWSK